MSAAAEREARAAVHEALAAFGERPTMRSSDAIDAALDEYRAAVAEAVREEYQPYRAVLRDFMNHGTRFDLAPTLGGVLGDGRDPMLWYDWIRRMDESVRVRAAEALHAIEASSRIVAADAPGALAPDGAGVSEEEEA